MENFLDFTGPVKLLIIERALLTGKGISKKEDSRKILTRLIINEAGLPDSELKELSTREYIYNSKNQLILLREKAKSGQIIEEIKRTYSGNNLIKKERIASDDTIRETREFKYDGEGRLLHEKCGSRLFKYDYNSRNLVEKEYRYYGRIPELALIYKHNEAGKIIEIKTVTSEGKQIRLERFTWDDNLLTSHFCLNENNIILADDIFEYSCFHDGNWLKRIKYSLKSKEIREPVDLIYRSITYTDTFPEVKPLQQEDLKVLKEERGFLSFNDGSSYRGEILEGMMDGKGYIKWSDGSSFKGTFKNNKMDGKGILTWSNGDIYSGSFIKGQMDGIGRLRWKDGKTFYGLFKNNRRTNQGIIEED